MDQKTFEAEVQTLLTQAHTLISDAATAAFSEAETFKGWYPHELALWNIGEKIRLLSVQHSKALPYFQMQAVLEICTNVHAGKGRQSFVLLFGKCRYASFAESLVPLLTEDDLCGQVINALYKMRASGYASQICPFLANPKTWIRQEAKRYLQKYS